MSIEPLLGSIGMFAGNFAPRGWALCQGQILSIAQNTALFSILGTTYGGNGQTTFALPNLSGRAPIGQGQGPGLSPVALGQMAGTENTTLTINNLPAHSHPFTGTASMACTSGAGNADSPVGNIPAGSATDENYAAPAGANGSMAPTNISGNNGSVGGNQPFSIMQPYLGINFCIALEGVFPSRN